MKKKMKASEKKYIKIVKVSSARRYNNNKVNNNSSDTTNNNPHNERGIIAKAFHMS